MQNPACCKPLILSSCRWRAAKRALWTQHMRVGDAVVGICGVWASFLNLYSRKSVRPGLQVCLTCLRPEVPVAGGECLAL